MSEAATSPARTAFFAAIDDLREQRTTVEELTRTVSALLAAMSKKADAEEGVEFDPALIESIDAIDRLAGEIETLRPLIVRQLREADDANRENGMTVRHLQGLTDQIGKTTALVQEASQPRPVELSNSSLGMILVGCLTASMIADLVMRFVG